MKSVASFFRSCCKSDDAIDELDLGKDVVKKAVNDNAIVDLDVNVINQKIPDVVVTPGPSALEDKMPHGCLVVSELTPKQGSLNPLLFQNSLLLGQKFLPHKKLDPSVDITKVFEYTLQKYKQAPVDMPAKKLSGDTGKLKM